MLVLGSHEIVLLLPCYVSSFVHVYVCNYTISTITIPLQSAVATYVKLVEIAKIKQEPVEEED